MKISELLPHKAVQAAEQAEQQTTSRDDGRSVAENFKKHLEQVNKPAQTAGLDPLKARETRDEDGFRQALDRDASLRSQEPEEEPVRPEKTQEPARQQDEGRNDNTARDSEQPRHKDQPASDERDSEAKPVDDKAETGEENTNADTTKDSQSGDEAPETSDSGQEGQADNANSEQTAAAPQTETGTGTDTPAIASIAAGSGVQQNTGNPQGNIAAAAQGVTPELSPVATETQAVTSQETVINPAASQKAATQQPAATAQAVNPATTEAARQTAAQAAQAQQRNPQQNQQTTADPALAALDGEDGIDANLQSLSQRSMAAEKSKAAATQNGTQQQVKANNDGVAQAPVQTLAQKAEAALGKLADPMATGGQVRQGGQEMSQAQATSQNQSNIAASATGQQAVDNPNKVVTLSTPRGAAHMPPTQQVALHISKGLEAGANKININLKPVELGRVEVQLEIARDGGVTVKVTADRQETLDLLKNDSSSLKDAIEDSGLNLENEDMEFNLREDRDGDLAKEETGNGEDDADDTATANDNDIMSPEETEAAIRRSIIDRALDITV